MKSPNIFIPLPLFLMFVLPSTKADEVTFNGTFRCDIPSRSNDYCMLLRYMESDIVEDDPISIGKIECEGPKESTVHVQFNGGDGAFNNYYEFYVDISHTCTHDGQIRLFRRLLPHVNIDTWSKKMIYEVDLTDRGEAVSNFDDHPGKYLSVYP